MVKELTFKGGVVYMTSFEGRSIRESMPESSWNREGENYTMESSKGREVNN